MKLFVIIFIALNSLLVSAGGSFFTASVKKFKQNDQFDDQFKVELVRLGNNGDWPDKHCDSITVEGRFDAKKWVNYQRPMSLKSHKASLDYLSRALGKPILFGTVGNGLQQLSQCKYQSKGLFIEASSLERIVFSVFDSI